jgi:hypothetical protein
MRKQDDTTEAAAEWLPIESLTPWADNPRSNDHAVPEVAKSIKRFGFASPIIARPIDGGGLEIVAGHTRHKAAQSLGLDRVPVRVMDLDPADAKLLALADNRLGELADWTGGLEDILRGLDADGVDLDGLGWSTEELDALTAPPPIEPDGSEDDVPDLQEEVHSKPGEVYELGPHRLACGDCTDGAVWDAAGVADVGAVIADPPYGMALDTEYAKIGAGTPSRAVLGNDYRPVLGDDRPFDAEPLIAMLGHVPEQFWWGADYYRRTIPDGGSWIVWDKRVPGLEAAIGNAFELCWSRQKHKRPVLRYLWAGFTAKERGEARVHPTQKPVAMIVEMIGVWVQPGAVVLDPFAGSGTTLIACAMTGRRARLIELDPRYCDVIRRRWTRWAKDHGQEPGPGALE